MDTPTKDRQYKVTFSPRLACYQIVDSSGTEHANAYYTKAKAYDVLSKIKAGLIKFSPASTQPNKARLLNFC